VLLVSHWSPEKSSRLATLGAQPIIADVMDCDGLLRAVEGRQADAIMHVLTALPKSGPLHHRDMYPTDALRDVGTANLLAAARKVGARKILVESMHLGYGYGDWGKIVLTEKQPFAPPGRTRALERHLAAFRSMEQQIFEATRAGWIEGISLRFGAFYGPGATDQIVKQLQDQRMPLPGDGHAIMSWIYIEDAAATLVSALERGKAGEAYNIVDDEPVTLRDFLTVLAQAVGARAPRSIPGFLLRLAAPYAYTFLCATSLRASNAKARQELGWTPGVPARQHIAKASGRLLRRWRVDASGREPPSKPTQRILGLLNKGAGDESFLAPEAPLQSGERWEADGVRHARLVVTPNRNILMMKGYGVPARYLLFCYYSYAADHCD